MSAPSHDVLFGTFVTPRADSPHHAVAVAQLTDQVGLDLSVATLDLPTDGRVELGLGAGALWDAVEAVGGARRTPGAAADAGRRYTDHERAFSTSCRLNTMSSTKCWRRSTVPSWAT